MSRMLQRLKLTFNLKKLAGRDNIHINLWDDYYEDGYIPEGEIQETYMYVESDLTDGVKKDVLSCVLNYIRWKKIDGLETDLIYYDSRDVYPTLEECYQYAQWQITFKHLSHKHREDLIEELNSFTHDYVYFDSSS